MALLKCLLWILTLGHGQTAQELNLTTLLSGSFASWSGSRRNVYNGLVVHSDKVMFAYKVGMLGVVSLPVVEEGMCG